MKIKIEFNCDNDAFQSYDNLHNEISSILSQLSEMTKESLPNKTRITDINGNTIGYFQFIKGE